MISNFFFLNNFQFLNNYIILIFFLILLSTLFVIIIKNTIHAIFFFMLICIYLTELALILQMEFLALSFVIIYLGAICVLILFQVKLVKLITEKNEQLFLNNTLFIPCLLIFLIIPCIQFATIYFSLFNTIDDFFYSEELDMQQFNYHEWISSLNSLDTLKILGIYIYNYNFIYIILGSLLLILAMIGTIILTLETKKITNKKNV